MQAVFVTHDKLSIQHVIRQRVVAGQQRQQRRRISVQQFFSFVAQQHVTQTFQHGNRLIIRHGDGHEHRCAIAVYVKCAGRTADRDSTEQVAFSTVVQPDTLSSSAVYR